MMILFVVIFDVWEFQEKVYHQNLFDASRKIERKKIPTDVPVGEVLPYLSAGCAFIFDVDHADGDG
jgi:hypothetical protein